MLLGESTNPPGNTRIRDETLPTENFLYFGSTHEKLYDNLSLDQRKEKALPPSQISANLSLRRKPVVSKAPQAYESIASVTTAHLADAEAPIPTSNHYEKPIDSQSYGRDMRYPSIDTIYCKYYPRLPAEHLRTRMEVYITDDGITDVEKPIIIAAIFSFGRMGPKMEKEAL